MSLPRKDQLIILTLARLAEPLTQFSIQAYIFHMVRSFDPTAPDARISARTGTLQACFTGAQFLTAVAWGRAADADAVGRKRVLLCGLLGTTFSCLAFGLARSYPAAVVFRLVGGGLNGNVGVMRTMISEIIEQKRFQSRAFLLLPMCFNIGVIIGPMVGGALADPVQSYPGLFGPDSTLGGKNGVHWMQHWPYLLPNLFGAAYALCACAAVFLGLEEVRMHLQQDIT